MGEGWYVGKRDGVISEPVERYEGAVHVAPAEAPADEDESRQVGFRITHFEACSTFTRVTACMIAKSLEGPSTPKASTISLPPSLLRLLPAGATVAGRDLHPLNDSAFARRTRKTG